VIGKKPVYPPPLNDTDPQWRITIDESSYGSFSNIPFDHQKPVFELYNESTPNNNKKRNTIVFGRTCDSGDYLGDDICIPDVKVGDKLKIQNMGAYTTVTASEFNGFPKPHTIYTN
jgi:ornithine decarboxylase